MDIFNISLEFDRDTFLDSIKSKITSNHKGYVCVVDGNVLSKAHRDIEYRKIVKNAFVNTCDGNSIATMANLIYGTKFSAFNGPNVFKHFVESGYKQVLVGNTEEIVKNIRTKVQEKGITNELMHIDVPFCQVEEFDYQEIASRINKLQPDIIWVSLGAPKQEQFMSRLLPYLQKGVMFGIGAAFNYYIGVLKASKNPHFMWVKRMFQEPKKQKGRAWNYIKVLPSIFIEEIKKKNKKKQ